MSSLWIWPFELEEKIGEGGMGVVYRGRYVKNDRRVAVKLLPLEIADEIILARFEREVEILKTLRHPNIVHSFGGVCEDKRRFYAMELVEGGSLEDLLRSRGGRLPWQQAVEFASQICAALQYAHDLGIVHRDIKPGNFLLTKLGKLKLSDFGLATVASGHKLTDGGKTVGSFRYMAPEQVRGRPAPVPQTDLYALGCVLYQMVAGRPPFDGTTAAELLNKHLSERPPDVSEFAPDCPIALQRLIHALLAKRIEDRPASAAEVLRELQAISLNVVSGTALTRPAIPVQHETAGERSGLSQRPGRYGWLALVLFIATCVFGGMSIHLWHRNQELAKAEDLWIEAFQSKNLYARKNAAVALGKLGAHSDRAVAALEKGLDSKDPQVRAAAIAGLGESGFNARRLAPRIFKMKQRADVPLVVYRAAEAALQKIRDSEEPPGLPWGWITLVVLVLAGSGAAIWFQRRRAASTITN